MSDFYKGIGSKYRQAAKDFLDNTLNLNKLFSMTLGYRISVPDNKHYMLSDILLNKCAKYSDIYHLNILDSNFKITTKKDISTTYDGFTIVSEKFRFFCEKEKYRGLEFVPLPNSRAYYWFKIKNILKFDVEARKTQFTGYSKKCDGYVSIIGGSPVCLKTKIVLKDRFYRSDICFGNKASKLPVMMIGEPTKQKLKSAGFKDIFFERILDKYSWQEKGLDPNELIILP